jgi:NitT/TauT family transport system substrate-binding protein
MKKLLTLTTLAFCMLLLCGGAAMAKPYKLAWSHYTGWEPWAYAKDHGIMKKWADKYGIEVEIVLINDYIESINLYTSGAYDACTMTNMDALTIPAVGGVDSTALIVGDFSNGNDGIVVTGAKDVKGLKGKEGLLVELSVSHYLLTRALDQNGMTERDVTLVNTSDADIASVYTSNPKGFVVTWNPLLMQVMNVPGANMVFDSSNIPGEIIDLTVVRTDAPDSLKKALAGAWFETMAVMSGRGAKSAEAIDFMARVAGATPAEFKAQLKTTAMFYQAKDAVDFTRSPQLRKTMERVRDFSFDKGLYAGASSRDFVGIAFPDGSVLGDKANIKLRFDADIMNQAASGQL